MREPGEGLAERPEGTTERGEGLTERPEGTTERGEGLTERPEEAIEHFSMVKAFIILRQYSQEWLTLVSVYLKSITISRAEAQRRGV